MRRILIVDDAPSERKLYGAYLAGVPCELDYAADGVSALSKVRSFKPDIILLDIVLPDISGFEICRLIKDDPATKKILVLMLTSLHEREDMMQAIDVHTNDYLTKPISKSDLVTRVEQMLKLKDISDRLSS